MKRLDRYLARTIWMSILLVLLVIVGIDALFLNNSNFFQRVLFFDEK